MDISDEILPAAIVTGDDGLELVLVDEVGGELRDRVSGAPVDLVSVVVVVGLPELEHAA